jgi:hypothetical protein
MKWKLPDGAKTFFVQLVTITGGVLIALSLEGLVEWNDNRALVREARATIVRELADNQKELNDQIAAYAAIRTRLDTSFRLANELLEKKSSDIRSISFERTFPSLKSASWHTAERTGALAHMDYDEVQRYSRIYALQDLLDAHQRRTLERLSGAVAIVALGSPFEAAAKDLETFRAHVMAMLGDLLIEQDLARALNEAYQEGRKQ